MHPGIGFAVMLGLAVLFYKAADIENMEYPILWGAASILLYVGAGYLGAGLLGTLGLQALLFVLLGVFKYRGERRG